LTSRSFILPAGKQACLNYINELCTEQSYGTDVSYVAGCKVYTSKPAPNKPHHKYRVTVERYRKTRSNEQNRYLWGVAYPLIEQETGNSKDALHEVFCGEFFGWVKHEVLGKQRDIPRRTTTKDENGNHNVITTTEFMDFCANMQRIAAEYGVYVPSPNE